MNKHHQLPIKMSRYILLALALLFFGPASPAQNTWQGISDEQKLDFVQKYIQQHGLDKYGQPHVVITDAGNDQLYGRYFSPKNTQKYAQPTIELHPSAFASLGELETALRHELRHYHIDQGRLPVELLQVYKELKHQIPKTFDFSAVGESLRESVLQAVIEIGQQAAEEWVIAKLGLEEVATYEDPDHARAGANSVLQTYQKNWEDFWRSPKRLVVAGKEVKISPVGSQEVVMDSLLTLDVSGTYECESGESCLASGTHYDHWEHLPVAKTVSPLIIRQQGQKIMLHKKIEDRWEDYNDGSSYMSAGSFTQTLYGEGMITGKESTIHWTVTIDVTAYKLVSKLSEDYTVETPMPARSNRTTFSGKMILLEQGGIQFISDSNIVHNYKKIN